MRSHRSSKISDLDHTKVQKMLLGTYRLQDPNGGELQMLVHGNRLLKANIRTTDELRKLWASPATKDQLRKRNVQIKLVASEPENMEILERYLLEIDEEPSVLKK